ncbi:McrB family protein [Streptococcus parasuis]|uniref:McrB family protein n=1 Tax=Streptococcus parasuis TaxID=1501662 RepID=UPI003AACA0FE
MKVYLRKLTPNDTNRQIETTKEAFIAFFGGQIGQDVNFSLTAPNGASGTFRVSLANGGANSYRFAKATSGGSSLGTFLQNNVAAYRPNDILKITNNGQINQVEIIKPNDPEYMGISSLIQLRQNPTLIIDDYYFSDSIFNIASYIRYKVDELDLHQEIDDFNSELDDKRNSFLSKFSVQSLKAIPTHNLDNKLFGKKDDDSLAYHLCDNVDFNLFGSARQGNTTRVSWNGSDFVQYIKNIDDYIQSVGTISTLDEYEELWTFMSDQPNNYYSQRIWVRKYLHILYPEIFVSQFSEENKKSIFNKLRLVPETDEIKNVFRLSKLSELAQIPTDYFWPLVDKIDKTTNDTSQVLQVNAVDIEQLYLTKCGVKNSYNYNRIFFGAPGTGKSFKLDIERKELLENGGDYERVTFHPDYSYSQFVGSYKPVPIVKDGEEKITYEYVPGPFMRILVKALLNSETSNPYLLVIEEINRANVAAVFGEVFQLLDRKDGISEYAITLSEDMKKYIVKEFDASGISLDVASLTDIKLPDNLFIWSTMNSADQGVFPMDTAFKRRWDFKYFGIDEEEQKVSSYETSYGLNWNKLRKAINELLSTDKFKINEDKLMGPFFVNPEKITSNNSYNMDNKKFNEVFKNKVIMYLFDDAVKQRRGQLFASGLTRYSQICTKFDSNFEDDGSLKAGREIGDLFDIFQEKDTLLLSYNSY